MSLQHDSRIYQGHSRNRQPSGHGLTRALHAGLVKAVLIDNRLRVRIGGLDDQLKDDELPICTSLLPLHIGLVPAAQEIVQVLLSDTAQPYSDRFWIGPTITHYRYLPTGQAYLPSTRGVTLDADSRHKMGDDLPLSRERRAAGLYPEAGDKDNLWFSARGRSDLLLGADGLALRTGKTDQHKPLQATPDAEAALRLYARTREQELALAEIEADIIHLIGRSGEAEAVHPVGRADVIASILRKMMVVIQGHVHPYHGKEPIQDEEMKAMIAADLTQIGSPGVLTN